MLLMWRGDCRTAKSITAAPKQEPSGGIDKQQGQCDGVCHEQNNAQEVPKVPP